MESKSGAIVEADSGVVLKILPTHCMTLCKCHSGSVSRGGESGGLRPCWCSSGHTHGLTRVGD